MSASSRHVKSCEVYSETGPNEPVMDVPKWGVYERFAVYNAGHFLFNYFPKLLEQVEKAYLTCN